MAALDTPWMSSMPASATEDPSASLVGEPPTVAAFSPASAHTSLPSHTRQRSTILVHQKSPLLVATPPQITRALAYSHPFLLPLNKLVGLLSWSTGDAWESFLLLASFWAATLYGDAVLQYAGPILFALFLIVGMWSRRYSPLSTSSQSKESSTTKNTGKTIASSSASASRAAANRKEPESSDRSHKSLDSIVETLNVFTARCNVLLEPFIVLTDFLSTQRTATSTTTRPALTSLFLRILLVTPFWYLLTLKPLYLITPRRVILFAGTVFLSWHSRPMSISRAILWRSRFVRRSLSVITGLSFAPIQDTGSKTPLTVLPPRAAQLSSRHGKAPPPEGVRLTWTLWENQRRWLGIGWTSSMLAYERAAWTDDQLNPAPSKDTFELPVLQEAGAVAKWRWVSGSEWTVDLGKADDKAGGAEDDEDGWIYYDNKWHDGRRGTDGWGRYTRRRKWCRDAELVEVSKDDVVTDEQRKRDSVGSNKDLTRIVSRDADTLSVSSATSLSKTAKSTATAPSTAAGGWFRRRRRSDASVSTVGTSGTTDDSSKPRASLESAATTAADDDGYVPRDLRARALGTTDATWGVGDDAGMALG